MILVDTDSICAAIKDVFEDTRAVLEPAGALAIAGAKSYVERTGIRNRNLIRFVAERAELGEHREAILAVTIPEVPGSFRRFCSMLGSRNVTEFNYRYADPEKAHVFVGVQVRDQKETSQLVSRLKRKGVATLDISNNEMAKLHVRHLVGGRAPQASNELLYRFEFPERPGALMKFLESMSHNWNISLFHYRNHGADYGRVLVGMQVPPGERGDFRHFLSKLGYRYVDETNNAAYSLFLS
jgi:threonine dehydratase